MQTNLKAPISITDALSMSWKSITSNLGLFIGFSLLYFIVASVLNLIPGINIIVSLLGFIYPVSIYYGLKAIDDFDSPSFSNLFDWSPQFGKLLGGYIVLGLVILAIFIPVIILVITLAGGFAVFSEMLSGYEEVSAAFIAGVIGLSLLLAIPALMLQFSYLFLLCFKKSSIGEALSLSWRIGVANFGSLLLFALLAIGISILGLLCLGVGLLVAIPLIIGMQYYFLRSIFPEEKDDWDFMKNTTV